MNIQVVAVETNRGVRKEGRRLVVCPDSESYVIRLKLEDGRPAYLTGKAHQAVAVRPEDL